MSTAKLKTEKLIYWITTSLFAAFMTFSAIPDILMVEEAKQFFDHLGYPHYLLPFIGFAKLLGSITILIPKFKKLKEWAYAGLFFDLIGATYSNLATDGFQLSMFFMIPIFGIAITSYIYNQTNSVGSQVQST